MRDEQHDILPSRRPRAARAGGFTIIELLVESKSNLVALDKEGNTAIMVAASSPIMIMEIPTKESPSTFKVNFHLLEKKF